MSSAISTVAQKSGRSKFLIGIASGRTGGAQNTWLSAFRFNSDVVIPRSLIGRTEFNDLTVTFEPIAVGDLFLDLGRQLVVYEDRTTEGVGAQYLHRNVYRECMRVNGPNSEGVPSDSDDVRIFVKVFSTQGGSEDPYVAVARTG